MTWPNPIRTTLMSTVLALATTLATTAARAHGGEDHGETAPTAAAPATPTSPRATALTDSFELVAVLEAGDTPALTLYLDRADTNAPVANASIELESGPFKGTAKALAPGVYTLPTTAFVKPGHYPLTITVQSADQADLLDATLHVEASPDHAPDQSSHLGARWPWLAAAAALLITMTSAWQLQRRHAARKEHA